MLIIKKTCISLASNPGQRSAKRGQVTIGFGFNCYWLTNNEFSTNHEAQPF